MLTRICTHCGNSFVLDAQEVEDRAYSPLCTDCLRSSCESNDPQKPHTPEIILGELN
jgi:hypothetical protein